MKKFIIPVLIVVLLISLVMLNISCKKEAAETTTAAETVAEETTAAETVAEETTAGTELSGSIHFLAYPWFALSDETLAKYTEATGVEITQEVLGYNELNTKFVTGSAAGTIPADVFSTYVAPLAAHVAAGYVEPLDSYISDELRNDILGIDVFEFNGKLYGVPTYYDITCMMYNKELLQSAGISAAPQTLDELFQVCMDIKKAGVCEYPLAVPIAAHTGMADRWYNIALAYGGEPIFDENYQPRFTAKDSGGYKALEFMKKANGTIIDPALIDAVDLDVNTIFLAGDAAFLIGSPGLVNRAEDPEVSKIVGQKVGLALFPGSDKVKSATLNFYLDGLAVSSLSENKDAAWKFIEWWNTPETAEAAYKDLGVTPTRKSLLSTFIEKGLVPGGPFIGEQSKYGMPIFPSGIPVWFDEWAQDAAGQLNKAIRGDITVDEALTNMANKALEIQK